MIGPRVPKEIQLVRSERLGREVRPCDLESSEEEEEDVEEDVPVKSTMTHEELPRTRSLLEQHQEKLRQESIHRAVSYNTQESFDNEMKNEIMKRVSNINEKFTKGS